MKFTIDRTPFLAALRRAERMAARRSTIPMLSNLLIDARKSGIEIIGSVGERQVRITAEAQVDKPGRITCNAQLLTQFVAGLADGLQVEATLAAEKLTARAGRARIVLPTLPAEEFPEFPAIEDAVRITIGGATFARLLRSVAHAQSNEETRFYLNGIFLHRAVASPSRPAEARELVAVATDGHCLGRAGATLDTDLPDFPGIIVPREVVGELVTLAGEAGTVDLEIGAKTFRASAGDVEISTRLIDGTFPDYDRVVPSDDIAEGFETGREELIAAVKRVGVFASEEKLKAWPVKLAPSGRSLALSAGGKDSGEIADEIDAQTSTKVPIGVNARYLADALEALPGAQVKLRYADAGAPIRITDPADPSTFQIVMARRI